MKFVKIVISLLLILAIGVATLLFGINEFGATHIIRYVENESERRFGTPIQITDLHLDIFNYKAEIVALQYKSEELTLQASRIFLNLQPEDILKNWKHPKGLLKVKVVEPRVVYNQLQPPQKPSATEPTQIQNSEVPLNPIPTLPFDLEYEIELEKADLELLLLKDRAVVLNNFNLKWSAPSLLEDQNLTFRSSLILEQGEHAVEFPVQLSTLFRLEWPRLQTSKSQLSFGPLALTFNGSVDILTLSQRWALKAQVTNFKNLPYRPPQMMGEWLGRIMLDASIAKLPKEGYRASGKLHVVDLRGAVKITHDQLKITGIPRLNLQTDFQYGKVNALNPVKLNLNLDKANVQYTGFLDKKEGVPFSIESEGTLLNNVLKIPKFDLILSSMRLFADTTYNMSDRTFESLQLDLKKTDLKEMAQIIPAIDSRQTRGHLRTRISLSGPIDDHMQLEGTIRPLEIHNARTLLTWQNKDKTQEVKGLADANILVKGELKGTAIKTDVFDINADLSRLSIKHPNLVKAPRQKLLVRLNGSHKDKNFTLKNGSIFLPGGRVIVAGQAWGIQEPRFSFSVATTNFSLSSLQNMLPALKTYPIRGGLSSRVKITGKYFPDQPFEKLPVAMNGAISVALPEFNWPLIKTTKDPKTKINTVGKVKEPYHDKLEYFYPELPRIEALKRSNLLLNLNIGKANLNGIALTKITSSTNYKAGTVSISGKIGSLFGGRADHFKTQFSLFTPTPTTLEARTKGLLVERLLKIGPKQFRDLARGSLNADVDFRLPPLISRKNIVPGIASSGRLDLRNGTVKGLFLNRFVNDKMKGLKVLKIKPPRLDDVIANYNGVYTYINRTAKFSALNVTSVDERYQFRGRGSLNLDLTQNLTGELRVDSNKLSIPQDFIDANSDDKERFIFPQMNCQGPIASLPSCKLINPEKVLTRVAQHKLNKGAKKLEKQGRKALEDAIKDIFK